MTNFIVFLAGLGAGSFFNVCIHRLPRGESVVRPRSRCPQCGRTISWFDNIPLLSFLFLKARCRHCRARISWRYPLVELAAGFLWLICFRVSGLTGSFWIRGFFLSLLLVASVSDFETGILPDSMNFLGIGAGVVLSGMHPGLYLSCRGEASRALLGCGLSQSVLGLLLGGGLIYLTGLVGNWIFQRDSMGGGDVKLMALIGSFLGWQKVLLVFFTAPFAALPYALYQRWFRHEEVIPYGPFLSLAAAVQFFYGETVWRYFLRL